jgi:hypothetical protein
MSSIEQADAKTGSIQCWYQSYVVIEPIRPLEWQLSNDTFGLPRGPPLLRDRPENLHYRRSVILLRDSIVFFTAALPDEARCAWESFCKTRPTDSHSSSSTETPQPGL